MVNLYVNLFFFEQFKAPNYTNKIIDEVSLELTLSDSVYFFDVTL